MFLRRTTVRRGSKTHVYWILVRSVRVGGKVRKGVVASLGRLDGRGRRKAQDLAYKITGKRCEPRLFEPDHFDDDQTARIELRKLRVERARRFGDAHLGLVLWRALELDELFDALIARGREDVRGSAAITGPTASRCASRWSRRAMGSRSRTKCSTTTWSM